MQSTPEKKSSNISVIIIMLILVFLLLFSIIGPVASDIVFFKLLPILFGVLLFIFSLYICYLLIAKNRYDLMSGVDMEDPKQIEKYETHPEIARKCGWWIAITLSVMMLVIIVLMIL